MGGEFQCIMMGKFLKAYIMTACLVGWAMNFNQMETRMLEVSKRDQNLEKGAFIGLILDKCTQETGWGACHTERANI